MLYTYSTVEQTSNNFLYFFEGPKFYNSLDSEIIKTNLIYTFKKILKLWTRMKPVENMTAIGKIESFDETREKWETYVERVRIVERSRKTSDEELLGDRQNPSTTRSPKPIETAEHFRFYKRNQSKIETVLIYVARNNKVCPNKRRKHHRKTPKSTLLNTVRPINMKIY